MRKYYHLLRVGRLKGLVTSNRALVRQASTVVHHLWRHPQPPPPPLSSSGRNKWGGSTSVSQHYLHATLSNLTCNYHYHSQHSSLHTSKLRDHEDAGSPLHYQVTVKDREVISATLASGHDHWLPLSNLDLLLPPIQAGVFFCYKNKDNTTAMSPETVVKTIKTSLAGVLSTFYPLAGEIVPNSKGEPEVLCNNSGVEFVHAHADVELKDLDFHFPDDSVKGKLVPKIHRGLLAIQMTELSCGALIISCAIDHRLVDGYSLNMFLAAWAEFAQLKPISNIPSFRRSLLNPRHPPHYDKSLDDLYIPISSLPPPPSIQDQLYSRMYYITAESIHRLQSEVSSKGSRRSKLQSFTAFLWKLLAQGGSDDLNRTSRMGIVVNGRQFLTGNGEQTPSVLANHFGNVLSIPYGKAGYDELNAMPLNEVAEQVHSFVSKATKEEHFRGLIDWVELHRPETAVARIYFGVEKSKGEAVVVSSGQGLPVNDMDFGWGKPDFGSYHFPWGSQTGYITTMPSATKQGDWVVYVHLKQKDLDLIERLAPHVFAPLTQSHLSF